jgi:hypothetical protein
VAGITEVLPQVVRVSAAPMPAEAALVLVRAVRCKCDRPPSNENCYTALNARV